MKLRLGLIVVIFPFYPFFFLSILCMLTFNILSLFSGTIEARTLNFGIHYDNGTRDYESWREGGGGGGVRIRLIAISLPFSSIFPSFRCKFVSQFSQELCKLQSSNIEYICKMSDCIVRGRLRFNLCCNFITNCASYNL